MPAEQDLMNVAYQAAISQRNRYKEQRDKLEAELLAAQERHEEFKRVAMKEAELAQEERDSHAKAASEAMAREKALREAYKILDTFAFAVGGGADVPDWLRAEAKAKRKEALAGSPSEKPGSEPAREWDNDPSSHG